MRNDILKLKNSEIAKLFVDIMKKYVDEFKEEVTSKCKVKLWSAEDRPSSG